MTALTDPDAMPLADLLRTAAAMVAGAAATQGAPRAFLAQLEYLDGAADQAAHRAALLRAAASFVRLFTLAAPDAPGLAVLGAEVDPATMGARDVPLTGVAGTGVTFRQAFESCVGEGVEHLSQHATAGHAIEVMPDADALAAAPHALREIWDRLRPFRRDATRDAAWLSAADLADGAPVRVPADLCLRRPAAARDLDPPWPLSIGCAAGPDHLAATLHALLELVERDAVALWWRGGHRARLLPADCAAAALAPLRGGATARRTWFLDITSDIAVPTVVAASCDDGGFGLCCGHAARPTLAAAAAAAAREMAQMELAVHLVASKRAVRGEAALNQADRDHLRRVTTIDVARVPALHPLAPPLPPRDLPAPDGRSVLAALRQRLGAVGLAPCALDLTCAAFAIPVVRVLCPGLELGLAAPPGPRLLRLAERSGIDPADVPPL